MRRLSAKDEIYILEHHASTPMLTMLTFLEGRVEPQDIDACLRFHKLTPKSQIQHWTRAEDDLMREQYVTAALDDLRIMFPNRTKTAIATRASVLGLPTRTMTLRTRKVIQDVVLQHHMDLPYKDIIRLVETQFKSVITLRQIHAILTHHQVVRKRKTK